MGRRNQHDQGVEHGAWLSLEFTPCSSTRINYHFLQAKTRSGKGLRSYNRQVESRVRNLSNGNHSLGSRGNAQYFLRVRFRRIQWQQHPLLEQPQGNTGRLQAKRKQPRPSRPLQKCIRGFRGLRLDTKRQCRGRLLHRGQDEARQRTGQAMGPSLLVGRQLSHHRTNLMDRWGREWNRRRQPRRGRLPGQVSSNLGRRRTCIQCNRWHWIARRRDATGHVLERHAYR